MSDELSECPFCHSKDLIRKTFLSGDPYFQCNECNESFYLSYGGIIMRFNEEKMKWDETDKTVREKVIFT